MRHTQRQPTRTPHPTTPTQRRPGTGRVARKPPASGLRRSANEAPASAKTSGSGSFRGSANPGLAADICRHIGVPLGETRLQRFADGEMHFQLLENVRGADVFLVQPTSNPVDRHLVELLIMIDALKRASAGRIHGGGSVLRLCAAGPEGPAAGGDLVQAGCGPADDRRRQPRALHGPARGADSGLFLHPGRSFVREPGDGELLPRAQPVEPDGCLAGCGWSGTGAVFCDQDGCPAGHCGQAAHRHQRDRK